MVGVILNLTVTFKVSTNVEQAETQVQDWIRQGSGQEVPFGIVIIADQRGEFALGDVRGVDIGSYIAKARPALAKALSLPPGYSLAWSGEFEYMQRAKERLVLVVPATLVIIFLLLFMTFGRLDEATARAQIGAVLDHLGNFIATGDLGLHRAFLHTFLAMRAAEAQGPAAVLAMLVAIGDTAERPSIAIPIQDIDRAQQMRVAQGHGQIAFDHAVPEQAARGGIGLKELQKLHGFLHGADGFDVHRALDDTELDSLRALMQQLALLDN